jgi:molecular chaperone GrpE
MIHANQTHGTPNREAEYLDGWRHARAELDNFKKRLAAEQQQSQQRARAAAVQSLLTVADNFQIMIKHIPEDLKNHSWVAGVQHVARQLDQLLTEHGIALIAETNIPFDPTVHEAVDQIKNSKIKSGLVAEIVQPGYKLAENVLRPAKVKVSI